MTFNQFVQGLGFSMLTGGTLQGISALSNGRGFWTGNIQPVYKPMPTVALETPKMGLNKDVLRAKMENLPDEVVRTPDSQTFLRVESGDGKVSWVKVDAANTGTTVLGKYPDYINLSSELGAKRFSIPMNIWNKMTLDEQWAANVKFLDRMIVRGDNIVLSNRVMDINRVHGAFRQELDYLIGNGYRLSSDGLQMIK